MGAQSVAAVVTATVPEPCTTFSRPEMTKGMRMKGRPVFSTICARLSPAPETLSTWPSAPPAAVMNTMGPASFRVLSMMSMMALPPRRLPRVMMDRTAPMARAMLESPTKETMDRMGESSGRIMPQVVLSRMSTIGTTRGIGLAKVPGRSLSSSMDGVASSSFCASSSRNV